MSRKYFGTDGMRGCVNKQHMTSDVILRLGVAVGYYFKSTVGRHLVVIGKDTRLSGYMVETALVAGLTAAGMDAVMVGPVPTPAIPVLTKSLRADAGIMISASHNPYQDNGIKIFAPDGFKLSDSVEKAIEKLMDGDVRTMYAPPSKVGRAMRVNDVAHRYTEHAKLALPTGLTLHGIKVALDTANGASYKVAHAVYTALGAEVVQIGNTPNGFNINDQVGATAPEKLTACVVDTQAHIGLAFDGDADRLCVVDEQGTIIDGDQVIAVIAKHLYDNGDLKGDVVTTVMSNMGLSECLSAHGICTIHTQVGDRYVVEAMVEHGCNFGGEQSGHLVMTDFSTTGDGIVAGLYVLSAMIISGKTASQLLQQFTPYPQVLKNVRVDDFSVLDTPKVRQAIADAELALGDSGRTLIRKSGTEPLIRVMAEGKNPKQVAQVVDSIVAVIESV